MKVLVTYMLVKMVNTLEYESCKPGELFLKSREGIHLFGASWNSKFETKNEMSCPDECRRQPKCKSAMFDVETGMCYLKDVNRLRVETYWLKKPNFRYYEKRECPNVTGGTQSINLRFNRVVEDAVDCKDILENGITKSGVYGVKEKNGEKYFPIVCDMETLGGGWTVMQRRLSFEESFERKWNEYKTGFGQYFDDFWYGNERVHSLTFETESEIAFWMVDSSDTEYLVRVSDFYLLSETDQYILKIGSCNPDVYGCEFNMERHRDQMFNTMDRNNVGYRDCSAEFGNAGWWFIGCGRMCLNSRSPYSGDSGNFILKWNSILTLNTRIMKTKIMFRTV